MKNAFILVLLPIILIALASIRDNIAADYARRFGYDSMCEQYKRPWPTLRMIRRLYGW